MDFKVVFTEFFVADLQAIVTSIASHDSAAAQRLGIAVIHHAETLKFFPERHPRVRTRPNVRRFIVAKHFKVFYRISNTDRIVQILRFWDGRRGDDPSL